ncbi:hypothetical protein IWX48DRAFT_391787 [Phyllosticta citricarpa]
MLNYSRRCRRRRRRHAIPTAALPAVLVVQLADQPTTPTPPLTRTSTPATGPHPRRSCPYTHIPDLSQRPPLHGSEARCPSVTSTSTITAILLMLQLLPLLSLTHHAQPTRHAAPAAVPSAVHDAAAHARAHLLAHRRAEPRATGAGAGPPRLHRVRRAPDGCCRVQVGQRGRGRALIVSLRVRRRATRELSERQGRRRGCGCESGW